MKSKLLNQSDKDYKLKDDNFRHFHFFDMNHHINEKIIRSLEYIINQYNINKLSLDDIIILNEDYDKLKEYLNDFNYRSDYDIKDVDKTLYLVIEYLKKAA